MDQTNVLNPNFVLAVVVNLCAVVFGCGILWSKVDGQCKRLMRVEAILDAILTDRLAESRAKAASGD